MVISVTVALQHFSF